MLSDPWTDFCIINVNRIPNSCSTFHLNSILFIECTFVREIWTAVLLATGVCYGFAMSGIEQAACHLQFPGNEGGKSQESPLQAENLNMKLGCSFPQCMEQNHWKLSVLEQNHQKCPHFQEHFQVPLHQHSAPNWSVEQKDFP